MTHSSVTRFIAAPPKKVWKVMTDRMDEWWYPDPWRCETKVLERKSGGRWFAVMHGPEGAEMGNDGIVLHWEEGKRFVGTDAVQIIDGEYIPAPASMIGSWSIQPATENKVKGTRYIASAHHWSEDDRREHEEMGFIEGWKACADKLATLCEE